MWETEKTSCGEFSLCCGTGKMASSTAKFPEVQAGVNFLRMGGTIYHTMGPIIPEEGRPPQYAQIYTLDSDAQVQRRLEIFGNGRIHCTKLLALQLMLLRTNPFVQAMIQIDEHDRGTIGDHHFVVNAHGSLNRRYNASIQGTGELAIFQEQRGATDSTADVREREIMFYPWGGGLRRISDKSPIFDPLHFPLLHPNGELGCRPYIPHRPENQDEEEEGVTTVGHGPESEPYLTAEQCR
eukprot:jgi/Botrbrau1/2104/Bobra.0093s0012.1